MPDFAHRKIWISHNIGSPSLEQLLGHFDYGTLARPRGQVPSSTKHLGRDEWGDRPLCASFRAVAVGHPRTALGRLPTVALPASGRWQSDAKRGMPTKAGPRTAIRGRQGRLHCDQHD